MSFHYRKATSGIAAAIVFTGLSLAGANSAQAGALTLNTTTVQNTTGQVIQINDTGSDAMAGAEIYVQVGDGGSVNSPPGSTTAPFITNINIIPAGGIFASDNTGQEAFYSMTAAPNYSTTPSNSLLATSSVNTTSPSNTVTGNGLLATVTFDASSLSPGSHFFIQFFNVGENNANWEGTSYWNDSSGDSFNFTGTGMSAPVQINVVAAPEPATGLLMAGLLISGLMIRRRRIPRTA